jgi:acyl carrier protein
VSEVIEPYVSISEIEQRIKSVLAGKIDKPASEIRMDDDLLVDLGLDSLSLAELIVRVEEIGGKQIAGNDLLDATTVGDLVSLVSEHLPPQQA